MPAGPPTDDSGSAADEPPGRGRRTSSLSSVGNAARLLKEFGHGDRDIGVTDMARRLGIGKSSAHRLLSTLAEERLLEQDPHTGAYRLSLTMYELGTSVTLHLDLHDAASPVLDQLRNTTHETVQVAVLDGREVVYVERRESQHALRLMRTVGQRQDAHATSSGKVLMAFLPPERLDALLRGWKLTRRTPQTITDPTVLRAQLETIRGRGWAENIDEAEVGVVSVAAPIRSSRGDVVAAVSAAGPQQRLTGDSLRRLARPTVEAGLAISRRLGYREPLPR